MKCLVLIACLAATPGLAQEAEGTPNLIEEGAKMFLRGLMQEVEPAMDDFRAMIDEFGPAMEDFVTEIGPVLGEMLNRVDDLRHYEQPEFLPNGDIIIRRKPDAPPFDPSAEDEMDEAIEL